MPTVAETKAFILDRLRPRFEAIGVSEPADDFSLTESGVIDSFGLLEVVMALQDQFQIDLDVSDIDPEVFTTFGGLATVVAETGTPR